MKKKMKLKDASKKDVEKNGRWRPQRCIGGFVGGDREQTVPENTLKPEPSSKI